MNSTVSLMLCFGSSLALGELFSSLSHNLDIYSTIKTTQHQQILNYCKWDSTYSQSTGNEFYTCSDFSVALLNLEILSNSSFGITLLCTKNLCIRLSSTSLFSITSACSTNLYSSCSNQNNCLFIDDLFFN